MRDYLKRFALAIALFNVVIGALVTIAIHTAKADIYNPHPVPPANTVTATMLVSGAVTPPKIAQGQTFTFSGGGGNAIQADTIYASSTLQVDGTTTFNGVGIKFPNAQCANGYTYQNDGNGDLSCRKLSATALSNAFTAGETITAGDAVALGDGTTVSYASPAVSSQNGSVIDGTTNWVSYRFSTTTTQYQSLAGIGLTVHNTNTVTLTFQVEADLIQDTGSTTAPVVIAQATSTAVACPNHGDCELDSTFASPYIFTKGSIYWVVFKGFQSCPSFCEADMAAGTSNGDEQTMNGGSTYTALTHNLVISLVGGVNVKGDLYEASSASNNFRFKGFVGIAEAGGSTGASITADMLGLSVATTTQTIDTSYFLNDTNGQIGTSAGTNSLKIGLGLSSAGFLLRPGNP